MEERGFACDVHCASWTLDILVEAGSPALDVDLKLSSVKDCLSEATSSASSLTLPVSFSCFSLSSTCCTARKFGPSSLDTGLSVSLSLFNWGARRCLNSLMRLTPFLVGGTLLAMMSRGVMLWSLCGCDSTDTSLALSLLAAVPLSISELCEEGTTAGWLLAIQGVRLRSGPSLPSGCDLSGGECLLSSSDQACGIFCNLSPLFDPWAAVTAPTFVTWLESSSSSPTAFGLRGNHSLAGSFGSAPDSSMLKEVPLSPGSSSCTRSVKIGNGDKKDWKELLRWGKISFLTITSYDYFHVEEYCIGFIAFAYIKQLALWKQSDRAKSVVCTKYRAKSIVCTYLSTLHGASFSAYVGITSKTSFSRKERNLSN